MNLDLLQDLEVLLFILTFQKMVLLYTTHRETPSSAKADFRYGDSIKVTLQWVLTEWKANDPKAETFSGTGREVNEG